MDDLMAPQPDLWEIVSSRLKELDTKLDNLPVQLDSIRRENRETSDRLRQEFNQSLEAQRRELQTYFVAKAEFGPHQQFINTKLAEYDKLIAESRTGMEKWFSVLKDVETLKGRVDDLDNRGGVTFSRATAIIAVVISVSSFIVMLLQHVSFHP